MRAGFSFSYPSISLLLGQPLSIKKSYAGAIQSIKLLNNSVIIKILPVTLFRGWDAYGREKLYRKP
jgi:hypothetical protein